MPRLFLPLLVALLLLGLAALVSPAGATGVSALEEHDSCQCCPDSDEADCCDVDFGACCATSATAALPATQAGVVERLQGALERRAVSSRHLLRPRDRGPPPTPPPIG